MAARIPLHPDRRQSARPSAHLREPDCYDAHRRTLARRIMELCNLGRPAWRDARIRAQPGPQRRLSQLTQASTNHPDVFDRDNRLGVLPRRNIKGLRPISRRNVSPASSVPECVIDWRSDFQALLHFVDLRSGNRCLVWEADLGLDPGNDLAENGDLFRTGLARVDRPGYPGIQSFYLFPFLAR